MRRMLFLIVLAAVAVAPGRAQGEWLKQYDGKRITDLAVTAQDVVTPGNPLAPFRHTEFFLWAIGEDSILLSRDSGVSWSLVTEPNTVLRAMMLVSGQTAWVVGAPGAVIQLKVEGATPSMQRLQGVGETDFHSVYFLDANRGWVGGAGGRLLATQNGGQSWTSHSFKIGGEAGGDAEADVIRAIVFPREQNGVMLVGRNTVFYSEDGGQEWRRLGFPQGTILERVSIQGNTLWLAGGRRLTPTLTVAALWRSDDFGRSWKPLNNLSGMYGGVTDVRFVDANTGFLCVRGQVYVTRDSGASWAVLSDGTVPIEEIVVADAANLWGISGGALYRFQTAAGSAPPAAEPRTNY
ncbi:MAG: hypothetical protein HYY26_02650 [Acidobacteria bacterium]|nr:hypothetical protein [Acidobacteriota bacterium]